MKYAFYMKKNEFVPIYGEGNTPIEAFKALGYNVHSEAEFDAIFFDDRNENEYFLVQTCKTCGATIEISKCHLEWLKERGLAPFTHCELCRLDRKLVAEGKLSKEAAKKLANNRRLIFNNPQIKEVANNG